MSTSTSALKARHYNALANSLRQLQNGLNGSEEQMDRLAEHLGSMQKLGTHSAAQLLDKELVDLNIQHENEVRDAEEAVQAKQ